MLETNSKSYAFFCPQGILLLKNNLYIHRQGTTAENGGQVIYALEIARAIGLLGHHVDIYARNYGNADFDKPHEIIYETINDCLNVRIIHIPTSADKRIEKEHFYPYYNEYMTRAFEIFRENDYDYILGHYADGMFMAVVMEDMMFKYDGRRRATFGIAHSLGLVKADCFLRRIKIEAASCNETNKKIYIDNEYQQMVEAFNLKTRLICELAAMKRLDGIISVNCADINILSSKYGYLENKVQVVAGGINRNMFRSLNYSVEEKYSRRALLIQTYIQVIGEHRRKIIQNGRIVLGFGRLVTAKGIIEAVKSMKHLIQDIPQAVYIYIGGNILPQTAEEKEIHRQALDYAHQYGYEDRIFFVGRMDQQMINEWLNVSDVYLHAAHLEPFGFAPLEAVATGIPAVVSQEAGVCDVLKNNIHVLYTNPLQPRHIAGQVKRLLEKEHLSSRLSKAARRVVDECTWIARARTMNQFCKQIEQQYVSARANAPKVQLSFDKISRSLLFEKSNTMVPDSMRSLYQEVRATMEDVFSNYPTS